MYFQHASVVPNRKRDGCCRRTNLDYGQSGSEFNRECYYNHPRHFLVSFPALSKRRPSWALVCVRLALLYTFGFSIAPGYTIALPCSISWSVFIRLVSVDRSVFSRLIIDGNMCKQGAVWAIMDRIGTWSRLTRCSARSRCCQSGNPPAPARGRTAPRAGSCGCRRV